MARREHQTAKIHEREGAQGREYYIRYRVRVIRMVDGQLSVDRREKWHSLGLCSEITLRKAERERDRIMAEVNGQVYTIQSHVPFEDFITIYRAQHMPTLAVPTQANYDGWLRNYIEPAFKGRKLCDIKPHDLHLFLLSLKVADFSRKACRGVLASIWKRAEEWGYWNEQSPLVKVRLPKHSKRARERVLLADAQVRVLLAAVRPDVALIIETLMWTGMRISECLGLRWKSVNLDEGWIHVTERQCRGDVAKPKSEQAVRHLALGYLADRYQAIRRGPDDLVFPHFKTGEPYSDCQLLANYLTPIMVALKIKKPGVGWHSFRRMHLTGMSNAGATAFDVSRQAGHASMDTTQIYVLDDLRRRQETVKRMQERFMGEGTIQ